MKKALIIVLEVLTLACFSGAFAVQYFTEHKLGMARWVNYHYGKLTEAVPYDFLKYVLVVLAAVAAALLVWQAVKRAGGQGVHTIPRAGIAPGSKAQASIAPGTKILIAFALVVVAVFVAVTLLLSHQQARADFLIVALCGLAALFQVGVLGILALAPPR